MNQVVVQPIVRRLVADKKVIQLVQARSNRTLVRQGRAAGAVVYDAPLAISADQKAQARANIDSPSTGDMTAAIAAAIAQVVAGAGPAYDTLLELQAILQSDESAAAALSTLVGTKLAKAANLSDLASIATALVNLGLDQVNNTSDVNKPVSTAQAAALNTKRNLVGDLDPDTDNLRDIGAVNWWRNLNLAGTLTVSSRIKLGTTSDTGLSRSSAGTVAVGNGAAGDSSGTLRAGTGIFNSGLSTTGSGSITSAGQIKAGSGFVIGWTGAAQFSAVSTDSVSLQNSTGSGVGRLVLGPVGVTAPALKGVIQSGPLLQARVGDDTGYCSMEAANFSIPTASGELTLGTGANLARIGGTTADGVLNIYNTARTGFTRLNLGPANNNQFPALGVSSGSSPAVLVKNGDGTADAILSAGKLYLAGANDGYWASDRLGLKAAGTFGWSSTTNASVSADTALSRISAGVAGLGNGTPADVTGQLNLAGLLRKPRTVATLPTPTAGNAGLSMVASDLLNPTYGTVAAGGGAVVRPVICGGADWRT